MVFWIFLKSFYGLILPLFDQSETKIAKTIQNLNYCFFILTLILSKNMCKSHRKLRNAKTYPLEVQILQIFFFWSHFMDNLGNHSTYMSPHYQKVKLEFLFSVLGSMVSKRICKLCHKLKNALNLHKLTWSWQNKPWYSEIYFAEGKTLGKYPTCPCYFLLAISLYRKYKAVHEANQTLFLSLKISLPVQHFFFEKSSYFRTFS